eukprot:11308953-Ditylum_brightwellii.AAC.1
MVMMMMLTMVLMVLRSISYIYHKWLIVVGQIEVSKTSILFAMKMKMLTMVMKIVLMVLTSTSHISHKSKTM